MFDVGPRGRVSLGEYALVHGARIICDSAVEIGDHALISWNVVLMDTYRIPFDPAERRRAYYELVRENDLCLTHTLVAPQVNRAVHPDEQAGGAVALRVVEETDRGLIMSGARILATLAKRGAKFI